MPIRRTVTCVLLLATTWCSANDAKPTFHDAFERTEVGENWTSPIGQWEIDDGALVGGQRPEDGHGAVTQTYLDFADIDFEFRFKLAGSPGFNLVIDDRGYTGSHAGHICRVVIDRRSILLRDDKTGAMENDIFAARRDPKKKAAADAQLADKQKSIRVDLNYDQWYTLRATIAGDKLTCEVDGKPLGSLTSPGIGHASKTDLGFTVRGRSVHFDDVRAWVPGSSAAGPPPKVQN